MAAHRLSDPWIVDPITELVRQRMGEVVPDFLREGLTHSTTKDRLDDTVRNYRAELEALTKEHLAVRVAEGRRLEREIAAKNQAQIESQRFFHQPQADMDLEHWSKMSYWTIDEAVALSFGKDPRVVTWDRVRTELFASRFAKKFSDRREIFTRAKVAGQLFDSTIPGVFLAWAQRMQIPVPEQLTDAVLALGVQVRDWKSAHEEAQSSMAEISAQLQETRAARLHDMERHKKDVNELTTGYKEIVAGHIAMSESDKATIESLKDRIAELEALQVVPSAPAGPREKTLGTRERESLLKLLIGITVRGYGYDPGAGRSGTAGEIAGDLAQLGIPLDEDTIRKYLTEAKAHLPPPETD